MQSCEWKKWNGNRKDNPFRFVFPKAVQKLCRLVSSYSIVADRHLNSDGRSFSCLCSTHSWGQRHILCHELSLRGKKILFPIVHSPTGNVEVRCSVDHSDIYGSRCTFKCKLIFTVGDVTHNDTYLQNPKGQLWTRSKNIFLTADYSRRNWFLSWEKLVFAESGDTVCVQVTAIFFSPSYYQCKILNILTEINI